MGTYTLTLLITEYININVCIYMRVCVPTYLLPVRLLHPIQIQLLTFIPQLRHLQEYVCAVAVETMQF